MSKKSIVGHSHTPAIHKGVYKMGSSLAGRLDYNGPTVLHTMPKSLLETMADSMFGEGEMCGHCKLTLLAESHNPNEHARWKCQMCQTDWFGIEPGNDRRGAIAAQKRRTK